MNYFECYHDFFFPLTFMNSVVNMIALCKFCVVFGKLFQILGHFFLPRELLCTGMKQKLFSIECIRLSTNHQHTL